MLSPGDLEQARLLHCCIWVCNVHLYTLCCISLWGASSYKIYPILHIFTNSIKIKIDKIWKIIYDSFYLFQSHRKVKQCWRLVGETLDMTLNIFLIRYFISLFTLSYLIPSYWILSIMKISALCSIVNFWLSSDIFSSNRLVLVADRATQATHNHPGFLQVYT